MLRRKPTKLELTSEDIEEYEQMRKAAKKVREEANSMLKVVRTRHFSSVATDQASGDASCALSFSTSQYSRYGLFLFLGLDSRFENYSQECGG